ncbi:MAG: endolytic transglycosylase MltG [Bacteroidales bacterium]|nr:endolytic transglycosylase MltG [Bacteroidales bacterium]
MKKKNKSRKTIVTALVLSALALFACGAFYFMTYMRPNSVSGKQAINIYRATDYAGLLDSLEKSGAVRNMASFKFVANQMKLADNFKPGHYELKGGLTNKQIERVFARGWQTPVKLLVRPCVRDLGKMSALLARQLEADSTEIATALADRQIMESHGFNRYTYLAMFIPDTYEVYWTVTPLQLLDRLKKEYDAFWNDSRTAKAKAAGLTTAQVVTLASIVIEETKYEPEMPAIAGVYINRLKKGMLLQADPTVKYAVNDPSLRRILNVHLQVDSPYNTYKHAGLPPGPITTPSKAAIDAVLNYQHHDYLYFCADASFNGRHCFASSLAGHMENARRFHAALNARERAKSN